MIAAVVALFCSLLPSANGALALSANRVPLNSVESLRKVRPAAALSKPLVTTRPPLARSPCAPPARRRTSAARMQWADAGPPPGNKRPGGLVVAASGLAATLMTAASALSTTGTVATVAASAAGLFSFKLSKVWPTHRRADGAPPRIAMLSAPRPVVLL